MSLGPKGSLFGPQLDHKVSGFDDEDLVGVLVGVPHELPFAFTIFKSQLVDSASTLGDQSWSQSENFCEMFATVLGEPCLRPPCGCVSQWFFCSGVAGWVRRLAIEDADNPGGHSIDRPGHVSSDQFRAATDENPVGAEATPGQLASGGRALPLGQVSRMVHSMATQPGSLRCDARVCPIRQQHDRCFDRLTSPDQESMEVGRFPAIRARTQRLTGRATTM